MIDEPERPARLAVLIDADNASPRMAEGLFREAATIGEARVRRIYGEFSGTRLKSWSDILATYAITPHQNFANTTGKNASDIALVIDAMDLLHTGRFDAFCLVSSDSDFTRLAARIREQSVDVYGFGERKTPESFRRACKRFIYTEELLPAVEKEEPPVNGAPTGTGPQRSPSAAVPHIRAALSQLDTSNGWYFLGAVGTYLAARVPSFNTRAYGCSKLMTLIEKSEAFEVRRDHLKVYIRPGAGADVHGAQTGAP